MLANPICADHAADENPGEKWIKVEPGCVVYGVKT